jgi:hypothetical protein
LTFSPETIKAALREKMNAPPDDSPEMRAQMLLFEQKLLLLSQPEICIDPSIEVSRAMACIDWREKMWQKTHPADAKEDFVPVEKTVMRTPKKFMAPIVSNGPIRLSDNLQNIFAAISQRPM